MKKTFIKWMSLVMLVALLLAGCGQAEAPASETSAEEAPAAEVQSDSNASEEAESSQEAEEQVAEEEEAAVNGEAENAEEQQEQAPEEEVVQQTSLLSSIGENCAVMTIEQLLSIPPVTEDDWIEGNIDAPISILVYSDMECPYCSIMDPMLEALLEEHPDDIRLVWRHFPLSYHEHAMPASQAIEAAGIQDPDAFFELKARIFASREEWAEMTVEEFETWLQDQVTDMGLDAEQFAEDMQSEEVIEKIQISYIGGQSVVTGTPYVLFNGVPAAAYGADLESAFLNAKALKDRQYSECPEMALESGVDYQALLKTDKGDITIDLLEDEAPLAVNSFIFLAQNGWFDNMPFHRVIPDFVAQAGDPMGLGFGGPGYFFVNEVNEDLKYDKEGVVGMANLGLDTNGSQFFITYGPFEQLDGSYTIFGQVTDGMDVAKSLTARDPNSQEEELPDASLILSVDIIKA